jgi:Tfp pilus assembly protein FimT
MALRNNESGWTVVETIVIVLIVGIIATIAIPNFTPMLETTKLRAAALNIQRLLAAARTRAVSDPNVHCGVFFRDSVVMILPDTSGTPYVVTAQDSNTKYLGIYKLPKKIFVYSLAADPITNNFIVFRGDGSAKYGGSVYVVNRYNKTRTISVRATTGKIKVQ